MKSTITKSMLIGILISLVTVMMIVGCAQQVSPASIGGTLRIAEGYDSVSPGYPPKLIRAWTNRQVAPALETLLRYDETGKIIPWLATGYKEDVATKSVTLTLKKDVKFHDGTDFNAEAVKWNLDQCKSAKTSGTALFKSIDLIDDYTVRISLTNWDNTVISNLVTTVGLMISPTAYKTNGEDWAAKNPVGTGPFQFVSWKTGIGTKYKKFNDYWQKGKPYLDAVEFTVIVDAQTRLMSFKGNEFDVVTQIEHKDFEPMRKSGYTVSSHPSGSGAFCLVPDSINPKSPFANIKVRQATKYAFDNEGIVKTVYAGEAQAANQFIYKGHWAYNSNVAGYPFNPTKAKQLLAEAGYANGFKAKIHYATSAQNDMVMSIIQNQLMAVGIDVQLDLLQTAKQTQIISGGTWDDLMYSSGSGDPEEVAMLVQRYSGKNFHTMMQAPDEYLQALNNAMTAPNFETKQKYTWEVMKLMIDKYCMVLPIWCNTDCAVSQSYVHNLNVCKTPYTVQWTPADCSIEKK